MNTLILLNTFEFFPNFLTIENIVLKKIREHNRESVNSN